MRTHRTVSSASSASSVPAVPAVPAVLAIALVSAAAGACSSGPGGEAPGDAPTWHADIAPLVAARCQECHSPGRIAPFSLIEFDDAAPIADFMLANVEAGLMPPWGADDADDCTPRFAWKDDPRLSADELDLLRRWVEAGAPEGDPATAAPLPEPPSRDLDAPTHRAEVTTGFAPFGPSDQFICFVLDPELTQEMWLTGVQVVPGDVALVHHAVLTLDTDRESLALAGADGQYECFGSVGVDGPIVGGYTPGAPPFEMPPGTGMRVPAGSLLVMQLHYHPLSDIPDVIDRSAVDLRLQAGFPGREVGFAFLGNAGGAPELQPGPGDRNGPEFRVPAGASGHTETMVFTIPGDPGSGRAPIWSVFPHMHYVGVDMQVTVERAAGGEPQTECLAKMPRYDFDWQRLYSYDAPLASLPLVGPGDTVTVECTYDNTMDNPNVVRGLSEQGLTAPVDVFLGDQTLDEMCIGLFGFVQP